MTQDPNKSVLDDKVLGQLRGRQSPMSRFGQVDTQPGDDMQEVLNTTLQGIVMQREQKVRQRREALENYQIEDALHGVSRVLSSPKAASSQDVNRALDDATIRLLRTGGAKARQTASDIQKLRKQDKQDLSLTADEAYIRGHISYEQYRKMKQAGKDKKDNLLRSEKVVEDGTTKIVDYYGYTDDSGKEVVTDKKYSDFTKGKGGMNVNFGKAESNRLNAAIAKKNALQRRLLPVVNKGVNLYDVVLDRKLPDDPEVDPIMVNGQEVYLSKSEAKDLREWLQAVDSYEELATMYDQPFDPIRGQAYGKRVEGLGREEKKNEVKKTEGAREARRGKGFFSGSK